MLVNCTELYNDLSFIFRLKWFESGLRWTGRYEAENEDVWGLVWLKSSTVKLTVYVKPLTDFNTFE